VVGVPGQHFFPAGGGDALADLVMRQVIADLVQQLLAVAVGGQVHAVLEQLRLPIVAEIVGQQQRAARQRLEDAHVDIVANAAVEDDPRHRVGLRHLLEIALAHEDMGKMLLDQAQQVGARAGEDIADERDVVLLLAMLLPVHGGIAGERQPGRRGDAALAQEPGPVALGGEDKIEVPRLLQAPVEVHVRIDGPPGARPQLGWMAVRQAVVDLQVEIESLPGHALQLARSEMFDLGDFLESSSAVHTGCFRTGRIVEDQGHTLLRHGRSP